jgi:hypothetical protein
MPHFVMCFYNSELLPENFLVVFNDLSISLKYEILLKEKPR